MPNNNQMLDANAVAEHVMEDKDSYDGTCKFHFKTAMKSYLYFYGNL